jgi:hypothetical protein
MLCSRNEFLIWLPPSCHEERQLLAQSRETIRLIAFLETVVPYFGLAVLCVFATPRENVLFSNLVYTSKPQSPQRKTAK